MKVKNIVFSGVMAAILGATAADAAISVASKAYVDSKTTANAGAIENIVKEGGTIDSKVSALQSTVAGTYQTKADAATMQGEIDAKVAKSDYDAKIGELETADSNISTYVGTIPGTATATDIVGYIQEKTSGIATDTALSELTARVAANETSLKEGGATANAIAAALKAGTDAQATADDNTAAIGEMDLASVGADGSFIKLVSQADGKVAATQEAFVAEINEANKDSIVAPQTKAVKSYVDTQLTAVTGQEGIAGLKTQVQALNNNKANKATTLEGYGITDAYTKAQVDAAVKVNADAIGALNDTYVSEAEMTTFKGENTTAIATAKTEAVAAAAEAAKIYIDETELTASQTAQDTELKKYADDKAAAEAKKVQDTLKFLATADVDEDCITADGSNVCVLTMTSNGEFAWTPLTSPVDETVGG